MYAYISYFFAQLVVQYNDVIILLCKKCRIPGLVFLSLDSSRHMPYIGLKSRYIIALYK